MKWAGLLRRSSAELPGLVGTARVDRRTDALLRRVRPGDVAVLDHIDLDRPTADALVAARVAAVVNASPSISGRYPNLGPEALVAAGVVLVDSAGPDLLHAVADGATVRLHEGVLHVGEEEVARGTVQDADSVADAMVEARSGLTHQLEAFAANTAEFMRRERGVLLDGVGVPEVAVDLADRTVLVVGGGPRRAEELARLSRWVREHRPVLIGVGAGADALLAAGHRPALVVGDPGAMSPEVLGSGAQVVVPAHGDGHAPGLQRAQDLAAGAVVFPGSAAPEDLALLLAAHRGAAIVVTVGVSAGMAEFLDRGRSGATASSFLTRLQVGPALVDGRVVAALHRGRVTAGAVLLLVLAVLVVVLVALAVSDAGDALLAWLGEGWTGLVGGGE